MLIGAAVSPAGGPAKAVARGVERGAQAIQFFNQNPRGWKPRVYSPDEVAAFRAAMAASDVGALLIHAVYLLNCASEDPDIRAKSLASLTSSLRAVGEQRLRPGFWPVAGHVHQQQLPPCSAAAHVLEQPVQAQQRKPTCCKGDRHPGRAPGWPAQQYRRGFRAEKTARRCCRQEPDD